MSFDVIILVIGADYAFFLPTVDVRPVPKENVGATVHGTHS